ncbi:ATP-binding protein [Caballeronia sp. LZ043]|uniref:ATP-binding protein n=1 Tax=Caballeronia sp. LZ043 TaxID=3038569 RepID=UPI0028567CB8|nr:ATP-binding protein [Caballeronia sp. LZ043]MDR5821756.1 ATP-binding protein [Caballeronia sp. LZ043]
MTIESWLPVGCELPDGASCGRPLYGADAWQIIATRGAGRALLVTQALHDKWAAAGLTRPGDLLRFQFGAQAFYEVSCGPSRRLESLADFASPSGRSEAFAFASALRETRSIDATSALQDALYVETLGRLLPTYDAQASVTDDVVLGAWLTGGVQVSARLIGRLQRMLTWIDAVRLRDVVRTSGIEIDEMAQNEQDGAALATTGSHAKLSAGHASADVFRLFGRTGLESFFHEHVIDIVQNRARYQALGIEFPAPTILHGPPGCGKTFAVERLIEYLGWPAFHIEASTVASPYIHETSRKVSKMFELAIKSAPSVLVIDEMEAFLADREHGGGGSHHRVEEVAEFLRRIPEATRNEVLIIGMTNRIEMIDPAIMRRGRFDHVISVDFPNEQEVGALLEHLLASLPKDASVDADELGKALAGRPLSDVAFVVREGARLSARSGADELSQEYLLGALRATPSRQDAPAARRIGFV